MLEKTELMQHIAPTLAAALEGPFSGVATKFIKDNLVGGSIPDGENDDEAINNLLNDPKSLQKIKDIDQQFKSEMKKLNIDIFSLDIADRKEGQGQMSANNKPQILFSLLFLVSYFLMLAAIFAVEVSDTINMEQGENSLMGELQILFGVLTAGVGQILSFWFSGKSEKKDATPD